MLGKAELQVNAESGLAIELGKSNNSAGMSSRSLEINERPGLGIELDCKQLTQLAEITEGATARAETCLLPDDSIAEW